MSELFWYPVQGLAAVTLGVTAGLLLRALLHWLNLRHTHTLYVGPDEPAKPRDGDIWIQTKREYQPDALHPYNVEERP